MTLTGDVNSEDQKSQAAVLAKQAAPDYTIADEIGVRPPGAESQAKAVDIESRQRHRRQLQGIDQGPQEPGRSEHRLLGKERHAHAQGSVKTVAQKREAEKLAKEVPNVQQVVNEIEVKPGKHSSPNA